MTVGTGANAAALLFDPGERVLPEAPRVVPDGAVLLTHERACAFVKRADGKRGCEVCGRGKTNPAHLGYPDSLNVGGSSENARAYQRKKRIWQGILTELLEGSGLPRGLERIDAEGTICFPTRARRDQGNFRFMLEKALGDALVEGGWLADDDWARYEFGALRRADQAGRAATSILLFPAFAR